jgi:predicted GTPase
MGYGQQQIADLEATINSTDCDLVLIGTPIDLAQLLKIDKPTMRVRYELDEQAPDALRNEVERILEG